MQVSCAQHSTHLNTTLTQPKRTCIHDAIATLLFIVTHTHARTHARTHAHTHTHTHTHTRTHACMHSMSTLVTTAAWHDAQHKKSRRLTTTFWSMHISMQVWLSLRFFKTHMSMRHNTRKKHRCLCRCNNSLVHQHTHTHMNTNVLYWLLEHACGKSHLIMSMLSRTHNCKTKCCPKLENPQASACRQHKRSAMQHLLAMFTALLDSCITRL